MKHLRLLLIILTFTVCSKNGKSERIDENSGSKLTLYLTSVSMQSSNFWMDHAVRIEIDSLILLLKENLYDQKDFGIYPPLLLWEDIPKLLTIANDSTIISNFPINPLSSYDLNECYVGIVALWLIESIRILNLYLKKLYI